MTESKRILIVDDEPEHLLAMQMIFEGAGGFDVLTAGDASQAERLLDTEKVDLVILDIALPGETGLEFCVRLRARTDCGQVPVIAISAYPDYIWKEQALKAGCNDFVSKPFDPGRFVESVRRILGASAP